MFTLFQALKAALPIVPKKDIRPYLNGVHIQKRGENITVEATDGHMLFRCRVDPTQCIKMVDGQKVIIPRAQVEAILKMFKVVHIDFKTMTVCNSLKLETVEGNFPDVDRVIPSYIDDPATEISVNFELLSKVNTSVKALGLTKGMQGCTIVTNQNNCNLIKPFKYNAGKQTLTSAVYVVMGVR